MVTSRFKAWCRKLDIWEEWGDRAMVALPWHKLRDAEKMERDILRAVRDLGEILADRRSNPTTYTAAAARLMELYPKDGALPAGRLWVFVDSMVASGDLLHYQRSPLGVAEPGATRGLTPKGERRLYELENPIGSWINANWFPVFIAAITALIGIANASVVFLTRQSSTCYLCP